MMPDPQKLRRAIHLVNAIEDAGGTIIDWEVTDNGNIQINVDDSDDVDTSGAGLIVKNGGG